MMQLRLLFQLHLLLLLTLSTAQELGVKKECCPKRKVGPHTYTLIEADSGEDTLDMEGCLEKCAYRRRGGSQDPDFDQVFCFERGNQSSACLGDTSLAQGPAPFQGYVVMENLVVCGDFWDNNAGKVACREMGLGAPKEVFGASRFGPATLDYLDVVPVCSGDEARLESCKLTKNPQQCNHPAGVVCRRTIEKEGLILLDGLPVCSNGFTDMEATAICKEAGFQNGTTKTKIEQKIATGFSWRCESANLEACERTMCSNGTLAEFSCSEQPADLELVGSSQPGRGILLFRGGIVCDDNWDLQDASVACKELGFVGAEEATSHSSFGHLETPLQAAQGLTIPYTIDEVQCNGEEDQLAQCPHTEEADCGQGEAAGVVCSTPLTTNTTQRQRRQKRSKAAAVASAVSSGAQAGASIIGSAVEYFDKKEKEKQAYLKERPDAVNLASAGVEITMKNEKGYMDLGGEFQQGGVDVKIQDMKIKPPEKKSGGDSFTYPAGIGPLLMNGCYGSNYTKGDPCYANKRASTKCLNMLEAANFVGMGYDATGGYTHAGRRKSLIQRQCLNKGTYQGEDVPDTMNVFGIYDTGCQGKTYDSLDARSKFQREESKLGENEDLLKYTSDSSTQVEASTSPWTLSANINHQHKSEEQKETETSQNKNSRGEASSSTSKSITQVFEFTCRIRRYEIFVDEVSPEQLSEAFLQDYMNLPIRFFDFRNKAPLKYSRFLERWGTHYIKSASFGGKFTILRESTRSGTETKGEWSSKMQDSVTTMFESKASSSESDTDVELGLLGASVNVDVNTEGSQNQQTSGTASESSSTNNEAQRKEKQFSVDDLIVEGGDQKVASILSDKERSGFKQEFKSWLDSIPKYPKGYDFKFGELSDLVNMNYQSLLGDFVPCWDQPDLQTTENEKGETTTTYNVPVKDEKGDNKMEKRSCSFKNIQDFSEQMEKRRLSLKRAIAVYAKNKGRSSTDLTVPAGDKDCEKKPVGNDQIAFDNDGLLNGKAYIVDFELLLPIGKKIAQSASMTISFKDTKNQEGEMTDTGTEGRWLVNNGLRNSASQLGPKVVLDTQAGKVQILGVRFTYTSDKTGNYLEWTKEDCQLNTILFKNLKGVVSCNDTADWVTTPLATVRSLSPPDEYAPCNLQWSNLQMLQSDQSCVRFTAASAGPIYFALSAVPSNPETWYYIRISQRDVTVYKGTQNLDYATEASGAVGLGDAKLFQTYIICSEYSTTDEDDQTWKTRLTYGKISADETFYEDAALKSYLVYEDNEPIQPAFFSFGAGEFKVQVVDIENTDVPENVECAGDSVKKGKRNLGSTCAGKCQINNINEISAQTLKLKCFDSSDNTLDENAKVAGIGAYCEAECPSGTKAYPNTRTTCQASSKWTSPLMCLGVCDPKAVLDEGILIIGGNETQSKFTESLFVCTKDQNKINKKEIFEGSLCTFGMNTCGVDKDGAVFYQTKPSVRCSSDGSWKSMEDLTVVTGPICTSQPCTEYTEANITSSAVLECYFEDTEMDGNEVLEVHGKHNEEVVCSLKSCKEGYTPKKPDKVICKKGEWNDIVGEQNEPSKLSCFVNGGFCEETDIPEELNHDCDNANKVEGQPKQIIGGQSCSFSCPDNFLSDGALQCEDSKWTDASCKLDTRCKISSVSPPNGTLVCSSSSGDPVKTGTKCNIRCNEGYLGSTGDTFATCTDAVWKQTGACVLDTQCHKDALPEVPDGLFTCEDIKTDLGGKCPATCTTQAYVLAQITFLRAVSATMSSSYSGQYTGEKCIDGGVSGDSSMCHTAGEKAPWLALDFGAAVSVEKVVIHNRDTCCGDRLKNAEVRVADQLPDSGQEMFGGGQLLSTFKGPGKNGEVVSLTPNTGLRGRFVIVQINHSPRAWPLNLNEVTVWGKGTEGNKFVVCGQDNRWFTSAKCVRHGGWSKWTPGNNKCKSTTGETCFRQGKSRTGKLTSTRTCTEPIPSGNGGDSCSGDATKMENCNLNPCPINAFLTNGQWGPCSKTCGGGVQTKRDRCTLAQYNGQQVCTQDKVSTQPCNTKCCAVDGIWRDKSTWGACSKTCDQGIQARERTCFYANINCRGRPCSSSIRPKYQACNVGDGNKCYKKVQNYMGECRAKWSWFSCDTTHNGCRNGGGLVKKYKSGTGCCCRCCRNGWCSSSSEGDGCGGRMGKQNDVITRKRIKHDNETVGSISNTFIGVNDKDDNSRNIHMPSTVTKTEDGIEEGITEEAAPDAGVVEETKETAAADGRTVEETTETTTEAEKGTVEEKIETSSEAEKGTVEEKIETATEAEKGTVEEKIETATEAETKAVKPTASEADPDKVAGEAPET